MGLRFSTGDQDWESGTGKQGGFYFNIEAKGEPGVRDATELRAKSKSEPQQYWSKVMSFLLGPLEIPPRRGSLQHLRKSRVEAKKFSEQEEQTCGQALGQATAISIEHYIWETWTSFYECRPNFFFLLLVRYLSVGSFSNNTLCISRKQRFSSFTAQSIKRTKNRLKNTRLVYILVKKTGKYNPGKTVIISGFLQDAKNQNLSEQNVSMLHPVILCSRFRQWWLRSM